MLPIENDLYCFGLFNRYDKPKEDVIGFYSFHVVYCDERAGAAPDYESVMTYGAHVSARHGRILIDYDHGDPPSVRAGRALDLYRASAAHVRTGAASMKSNRAYFITDAGKVAVTDDAGLEARLSALAMRRAVPAAAPTAPTP